MNGIQIEHILDLVEKQSADNRQIIRREIRMFLSENKADVVKQLKERGELNIPTSYGAVKLTVQDLEATAA